MQLGSKEQETLRQYLLGRLPSGELASLEERLLTDSAFYEELLIAEDELIDQYLRGRQSQGERESFESHFLLTAERQQKTRFARSLNKYLDGLENKASEEMVAEEDPAEESIPAPDPDVRKRNFFSFLPGNPVLSYSMTAALVLLVGAVSWTALRNLRNPTQTDPGQVFAVVLTPGLTRAGGDQASFRIPSDFATLQLQLTLPAAGYQSYRAELLTTERNSVWAGDGLQPDAASGNKFINLAIPARLIKRDDYQVKLSGRRGDGVDEDVTSYVFRVVD